MPLTREDVIEKIRPVRDPEIGLSVVGLGLVYDAVIEGDAVQVVMTLTSPGCPFGPEIMERVRRAVLLLPGVREVDVKVTFSPPWDPRVMAEDDVKDELGIW